MIKKFKIKLPSWKKIARKTQRKNITKQDMGYL